MWLLPQVLPARRAARSRAQPTLGWRSRQRAARRRWMSRKARKRMIRPGRHRSGRRAGGPILVLLQACTISRPLCCISVGMQTTMKWGISHPFDYFCHVCDTWRQHSSKSCASTPASSRCTSLAMIRAPPPFAAAALLSAVSMLPGLSAAWHDTALLSPLLLSRRPAKDTKLVDRPIIVRPITCLRVAATRFVTSFAGVGAGRRQSPASGRRPQPRSMRRRQP